MSDEALDRKLIETTLLNMIVNKCLPFRLVESEEFQAFCHALNRNSLSFLPGHHSTVASKVFLTTFKVEQDINVMQAQAKFDYEKDIVRRTVQSAITDIHLSVDIWTSPNREM